MTLQSLRYLVAVVDTGSFSAAADVCFVTQPTLSTQLKRLEEVLGVTLIERTTKHVSVTRIGDQIVERARRILAECDDIRDIGRAGENPFSEPIRVGVISTVAPYLVKRLAPALRRSMSKLHLVVREGLTKDLLNQLVHHDVDAVVLAFPVDRPMLTSKRLYREMFRFACSKSHPLARRRRIHEADLREHRILLLAEGHCLRDQALALCRPESSLKVDDSYRATSLNTLTQLVSQGFGCTFLPELACPQEGRQNPQLTTIQFASTEAFREIGLVWRRNYPRGALLERIAEFVRFESRKWFRHKK